MPYRSFHLCYHSNLLGYSQTLPRGTHLMANYPNIQGNEAPITQQNIQLNPRQQPANTQALKKTKEPLGTSNTRILNNTLLSNFLSFPLTS